jgi:hypothetical protein
MQRHAETCRDMQRHAETCRDMQKHWSCEPQKLVHSNVLKVYQTRRAILRNEIGTTRDECGSAELVRLTTEQGNSVEQQTFGYDLQYKCVRKFIDGLLLKPLDE